MPIRSEGFLFLRLRVVAEQAVSKKNGCSTEENGEYEPLNKAVLSAVHACHHIYCHLAEQ